MTTKIPTLKRTTKGEPPVRPAVAAAPAARQNLAKPQPTAPVGLNFKVPAEFKRDFKIEAAMHGLSQAALLQQVFALWKQHKG